MTPLEEQQDEICARILVAVAHADGRVLPEEVSLIHGFFQQELRLPQDRLRTVQALITRLLVERPEQSVVVEQAFRLPKAAREVVFRYGVGIAVADRDLDPAEHQRLQELANAFELADGHLSATLRETALRTRDAFSVLELGPDASWSNVEQAVKEMRARYQPHLMVKLGVAFQNLAIEQLENIEWAYEVLRGILAEDDEAVVSAVASDVSAVETPVEPLAKRADFLSALDTASMAPEQPATSHGNDRAPVVFADLGLGEPIHTQLWRRELRTDADLRQYLQGEHKHFHTKTRALLTDFLAAVDRSKQPDDSLDRTQLVEYFENTAPAKRAKVKDEVPIVPEVVAADPGARLLQLEDAIFTLFADDERRAGVLCLRAGLRKQLPQTLEAIGHKYGVTRERIRQIEARALHQVRELFLLGQTKHLALHPDLLEFSQHVFRCVGAAANRDVLELEDYRARLTEALGTSAPLRRGVLRLFVDWNDLYIEAYDDERTFVYRNQSSASRATFCRRLAAFENGLKKEVGPLATAELGERFPIDREGVALTVEDALALLSFEPEWLEDNVFQVPLEALRRTDQVERVLREHGEALHVRDIAEKIREAGGNDTTDENLRNQLVADDRFKPVGRSGMWFLAEWSHVTSATILDVLRQVLSEAGRPLTRDEAVREVSARRQCAEGSIDMYLSSDPQFLLVGPDQYVYQPGATAADRWNRETVGQWVEEFFDSNLQTVVRMKELKAALVDKAGMDERSLGIMLGHHPAVISFRDRSERVYVRLRSDWREHYKSRTTRPRRPGLSVKVDDMLKEVLAESPSEALVDVVHLLSEELGSPTSSLYTYIRHSNVCEAYEDDGVKRLRLLTP